MTVGETLAEARYRAGFTVEELSELTRIRGTVIRSIEQDDYAACGGDLYVRGYVRAIAGAVGIDAQPLIHDYDMLRSSAPDPAAEETRFDLPALHQDPEATTFDLPAMHADPDATAFDLPAVQVGPDATSFDLPAVQVGPDATSFDLPATQAGADATSFDLPAVHPGADATSFDLPAEHPDPELPGHAPDADVPGMTRFDLPPVTTEPAAPGWEAEPAAPGWEAEPTAPGWGGEPAEAGFPFFSEASEATQGADGYGYGYVDEPASSMPAASADPAAPAQPPPAAPSAQPWPPPPPVRTVSTGRTVYTGRAVRQTGSFAALTQTGALRLARTKKWQWATGIVAVIAVVVAGVAGIIFSGGKSSTSIPPVNPPAAVPQAATSAAAPAKSASAKPTTSAKAQASKSAPSAAPLSALAVTGASAFGPSGLADGDNSDLAKNAIGGHASQGWSTQWYTTPSFGMLKHGTGLLLDLGRKETVSSVRLYLTQYRGLSLQIRAAVGQPAGPQDLSVVATAANAGGTLRLTLGHPATARYLLVWFTLLPPDGQGHYQESVYRVVVTGRR